MSWNDVSTFFLAIWRWLVDLAAPYDFVWTFIARHWWYELTLGMPIAIGFVAALNSRRAVCNYFTNFVWPWRWWIIAIGLLLLAAIDWVIGLGSGLAAGGAANATSLSVLVSPLVAVITFSITAGLTYFGWKAVYQYNLKLEEQKKVNAIALEKLKTDRKRLEDRIEKLYAPLSALCRARQACIDELLEMQDNRHGYFDGEKRTPEQMQDWRIWRVEAFMPFLLQMQDTILKNAHLLDGAGYPESFTNLMAHVGTYKGLIKKWEDVIARDKANNTNLIDEQRLDNGKWEPVVRHTGIKNFSRPFEKHVAAALARLHNELAEFDRKLVR